MQTSQQQTCKHWETTISDNNRMFKQEQASKQHESSCHSLNMLAFLVDRYCLNMRLWSGMFACVSERIQPKGVHRLENASLEAHPWWLESAPGKTSHLKDPSAITPAPCSLSISCNSWMRASKCSDYTLLWARQSVEARCSTIPITAWLSFSACEL